MNLNNAKSSIMEILSKYKHIYFAPLIFFLISIVILIGVIVFIEVFTVQDHEVIEINFETIDVSTNHLEGLDVVIDPGHGGNDPGAESLYGKNEAALVYDIALIIKGKIEAYGGNVTLTRERNEYVSLNDRKVDGDLFISLHSDAYEDSTVTGFTTFYADKSQESFALAINSAMEKESLFTNRGNKQFGYQVIDQIDYPGVLVELGYLSNTIDDYVLNSSEYKEAIADAIVKGINNYTN